MSIFRTARQVAFNDLLVALEESVDTYTDLANALHDPAVAQAFRDIVAQRQALVRRLQAEIRRLDDLPSLPDADREDVGKLLHRLHAALSADEVAQAVQERLAAERHIQDVAGICQREEPDETGSQLLADVLAHLASTMVRLRLLAVDAGVQ